MASLNEIQDAIILADTYSFQLVDEMLANEKMGCTDCCSVDLIYSLIELTYSLERRISENIYNKTTDDLYTCLMTNLIGFSGSAGSINPNASIPGTIINVNTPNGPQWFNMTWDMMESSDEDPSGARYTFRSPLLLGWNPSAQDGTKLFEIGVDYDMYQDGNDGVFRFRAGNGIYQGSYIRFDSFQTYIAPPLPSIVTGVILVDNQSTYSITYNDNGAGVVVLPSGQQYLKDPMVDGQSMNVQLPNPANPEVIELTYTVYDSSGNVVGSPVVVQRPPGVGLNVSLMDIQYRHVFIITST